MNYNLMAIIHIFASFMPIMPKICIES